jgi:hypothetical protein
MNKAEIEKIIESGKKIFQDSDLPESLKIFFSDEYEKITLRLYIDKLTQEIENVDY